MKRPMPLLVLITVLAANCGPQPARPATIAEGFEAKSLESLSALGRASDKQRQADPAPTRMPATAPLAPSPGQSASSALKLIWTAALQIDVPDFRAAVDQAGRTAVELGGYVSDRQSGEDAAGHERGQVTLRVPSEKFDGAVGALRKLGRVTREGIQTQDVTKAYTDLETRLRVKRETATRLREILTRQTGKVSEVLEVEREIARVVEEIEQAEGERRYLDNQVSLSTITLSLYGPDAMTSPGAFDPVKAALRQSLRSMGQSLGSVIELLAGLLPWLAALYATFRAVLWRFRRRG